jgi:hypothetical protein
MVQAMLLLNIGPWATAHGPFAVKVNKQPLFVNLWLSSGETPPENKAAGPQS